MTTLLKVFWDGNTPSLQKHRLSVSGWTEPLKLLLQNVRRAASSIDAAPSEEVYGGAGGRYTSEASAIDLEIAAIHDGCVCLDFQVTDSAEQQSTPGQSLAVRAVAKVISDIKAAASGKPSSDLARRYLKSLPDVSVQKYDLFDQGNLIKSEQISEQHIQPDARRAHRLKQFIGNIIAVGFEPPSITIKSDGDKYVASCTIQQVDSALGLRLADVQVIMTLHPASPKGRLLWLGSASKDLPRSTPAQRDDHFGRRWSRTLEILGS